MDELSSQSSNEPSEQEESGPEEQNDGQALKLEEMRYADARMGVCSACRSLVTGDDAQIAELENALLCADGHLLCSQCVQRFAVKSETSCVLCAASGFQESTSSSHSGSSRNTKREEPMPRRISRDGGFSREVSANAAGGDFAGSHSCRHTSYFRLDRSTNDDEEEEGEEEEDDKWSCRTKQAGAKARSYCSIVQNDAAAEAGQAIERSRRPIQCPRQDCGLNVAYSALASHFIFDHPEVPVLSVEPGELSSFIVDFEGLVYDSSRCLALLLVSGKLSGPESWQFGGPLAGQSSYKNRLPLPILAALLRCAASNKEQPANDTERHCGDVLIAWVAGLDVGNLSVTALGCSIQAIDSIGPQAFRSLTYTGPVNSLRTAQKPRDVFLNGDCVILHDGFIHNVTSARKNINFNVTIH